MLFEGTPVRFSLPNGLKSNCFEDTDDEHMEIGDAITPLFKKFRVTPDSEECGSSSSENKTDEFRIRRRSRLSMRRHKSYSGTSSRSLTLSPPRDNLSASTGVMDAVRKMDVMHEFIGDASTIHTLPLAAGEHSDLRSVSPLTVRQVVRGDYKDVIDNHAIIDCRYPYEYEGGHIDGALNLHTEEMIARYLLDNSAPTGKTVLVFHCEFSSKRGPKLLRYLRQKDREINIENYPTLCYPEIYILEGGYKNFYENNKDLCVPQCYVPMLHKEHSKDLRHFRAKSKSWSGSERRKCLRL